MSEKDIEEETKRMCACETAREGHRACERDRDRQTRQEGRGREERNKKKEERK